MCLSENWTRPLELLLYQLRDCSKIKWHCYSSHALILLTTLHSCYNLTADDHTWFSNKALLSKHKSRKQSRHTIIKPLKPFSLFICEGVDPRVLLFCIYSMLAEQSCIELASRSSWHFCKRPTVSTTTTKQSFWNNIWSHSRDTIIKFIMDL